ncbi:EfeM/EfeO family lipoprotein [Curtobacterium citreum]|uniref:EfeM/EfeO family lipoprotein n=1 Tax=Curtobacterium citreum TaxID=2036 RepID=UPI002543528E|nr:EfeM/EfeO family lipoprotein [Curtobacterium citreum]WIJ45884.1 EfeM/EfeO family lipoprotein [Curtobacterium citreum]
MSLSSRVRWVLVAMGLVVAVPAVIGVQQIASGGHSGASPSAAHGFTVDVGTDSCGGGWPASPGTAVEAGRQTFHVHNTSIAGVEVQLVEPSSGAVFLDVEGLGSGAAQTYEVRLPRGDYAFRCLPADSDAVTGNVVHVTGATHVPDATPGVVPVTRNDLTPAAKSYGTWIEGRLPVLLDDVRALAADAHAGDLGAARHDWLVGHVEYEQLGAAYGAFGDADTAIDGMPASGRTALDDPDLQGFHRIEALLWSGAPADQVASAADDLVGSVQRLQQTFPTARVDPLEIGLRAHEILENALRFEATGASDAGSHSELATIDANVAGTEQALDAVRGLLRSRYPELAATDRAVATLRTDVEAQRHPDGTWTDLDALDRTDRERVDADLDDAVELLAPIAAICDPRRTS